MFPLGSVLARYSLDRKTNFFFDSTFLGKCEGRFESRGTECKLLAILYVHHSSLRKAVCFSSQNNLTDIIVFVVQYHNLSFSEVV